MTNISSQQSTPRPRQRSHRTRELLERAALEIFSKSGFTAASTREIAEHAGVKQQLITYHYGSKLGLWKAAANAIFTACSERMSKRSDGLAGVDPATRIRLLVREFLIFSADHPELARFMMNEGGEKSPRLTWLYEHHTKELFELSRDGFVQAQKNGLAPRGDPAHLTYVMMGAASMFSQAEEYAMMTGNDPHELEGLETYIDLVMRLLFPDGQ